MSVSVWTECIQFELEKNYVYGKVVCVTFRLELFVILCHGNGLLKAKTETNSESENEKEKERTKHEELGKHKLCES